MDCGLSAVGVEREDLAENFTRKVGWVVTFCAEVLDINPKTIINRQHNFEIFFTGLNIYWRHSITGVLRNLRRVNIYLALWNWQN